MRRGVVWAASTANRFVFGTWLASRHNRSRGATGGASFGGAGGRKEQTPISRQIEGGRVALEVEWNNKDPFIERDPNNLRLLFDVCAIDVGVIITRASELQGIFNQLGEGASYGASTTHRTKLWPRLDGGGGCPVLTFAIRPALYVDDGPPTAATRVALTAMPNHDEATYYSAANSPPLPEL
jgi:hypothetical protein